MVEHGGMVMFRQICEVPTATRSLPEGGGRQRPGLLRGVASHLLLPVHWRLAASEHGGGGARPLCSQSPTSIGRQHHRYTTPAVLSSVLNILWLSADPNGAPQMSATVDDMSFVFVPRGLPAVSALHGPHPSDGLDAITCPLQWMTCCFPYCLGGPRPCLP